MSADDESSLREPMMAGIPITDAPSVARSAEFTPASLRMLMASIAAQLMGGTTALGLFPLTMVPIMTSLGWTRTQIGAMGGAFLVSAALGLPIWGYMADRFGARNVVLRGTALMGLMYFAIAALSGSLTQGYLSFALAGFCSALSVTHVKAQAMRFDRHRGSVLAVLGVMVGISFGVTPLLGKIILDRFGWRATYIAFGVLPLCVVWPCLFAWFRESLPARQGAVSGDGASLRDAIRTPIFWMIAVMAISSGFVFAGMQAHFVAFMEERGLSNQRAVNVLSVAAFGGLLCQFVTGWLLDKWRSPRAAIPFVAVALIGMLILQSESGHALTIAGVILLQSGVGGELSTLPYFVSRSFGTANMARIFGTIMLIAQLASGGSPVLLGMVHDQTGSYARSLPLFAGLLALTLILLVMMGRSFRSWR